MRKIKQGREKKQIARAYVTNMEIKQESSWQNPREKWNKLAKIKKAGKRESKSASKDIEGRLATIKTITMQTKGIKPGIKKATKQARTL